MSKLIVGIDLGTSNSCAALYAGSKVEILRNAQGERTTPSVVAFAQDGALLVGASAQRQAIMNPTSTIAEVKRLVGQRFDSADVAAIREIIAYDIERAPNGDAWVRAGGQLMSPPEVQAHVLEVMQQAASAFAGEPVDRAVITVPAFFDETQRQAVRDAATIAGLHAERILSEPTAAALAYGYAQLDDRRIVVIDLGGGTLDVTVMKVRGGRFEVLATAGDNLLGGADFDHAIARHLSAKVQASHGIDVLSDPVARQRLVSEAEQAKKVLTAQTTAPIRLPFLATGEHGQVDLDTTLSREDYGRIVADLVERIVDPCGRAVKAAGIRPAEIDDVLLVGGMTRSPIVQQKIGELFERKPSVRVNPDEAVAMGAALLGGSLAGSLPEVSFVDVAPRTIGLRAAGDKYVPLIRSSSPLPARASRRFKTTEDGQQSFELVVYQGESMVASKNRRLARVELSPIPRAPAGAILLDATFRLDENGKLEVTAIESGEKTSIQAPITAFSGLGESQVHRLAAERAKARADAAAARADSDEARLGSFSVDFNEPAPTEPPRSEPPPVRVTSPVRAPTSEFEEFSTSGSPAVATTVAKLGLPRGLIVSAVLVAALVALVFALR